KAMKPQKPVSSKISFRRRVAGKGTRKASATGTASKPPTKVRIRATVSAESSPTATLAATGEAPHSTTAASAARRTSGDIRRLYQVAPRLRPPPRDVD